MGLNPEAFWSQTPRLLSLIFDGKDSQFVREHNERAWSIWKSADLQRAKRLPPVRKLLIKDRDRKPQSAERMLAIAKQWTLLLGGEVTGKPN